MGILRWHKTRGSERQRKRCDAHAPKRFPCGHVTTDPAPTPLVSSAGIICGFAAGIRAHLGPVTALLFGILFPTCITKNLFFCNGVSCFEKTGGSEKLSSMGSQGKKMSSSSLHWPVLASGTTAATPAAPPLRCCATSLLPAHRHGSGQLCCHGFQLAQLDLASAAPFPTMLLMCVCNNARAAEVPHVLIGRPHEFCC